MKGNLNARQRLTNIFDHELASTDILASDDAESLTTSLRDFHLWVFTILKAHICAVLVTATAETFSALDVRQPGKRNQRWSEGHKQRSIPIDALV
jgi:hypothetical protein